eukprot:1201707-Amphidinium_carterae.1
MMLVLGLLKDAVTQLLFRFVIADCYKLQLLSWGLVLSLVRFFVPKVAKCGAKDAKQFVSFSSEALQISTQDAHLGAGYAPFADSL